jgi:site-specific DNA-methyltransferase (adenine-specific)
VEVRDMIELYNMDCMDAMKEMPNNAFDLAIVDPPYGIDRLKNPKGRFERLGDSRKANDNTPTKEYFNQLFRVSINQIVWGYNHFSDLMPKCPAFIFWDKDVSVDNYSAGELAWTSFKGNAAKVKVVWDGFRQEDMGNKEHRIHPTQKPVKLYEWLLTNYAKEGDKILDTHLGSGSIAIACHDRKFDLTGYELDAEYYEAATKRLTQHQAQQRLF